LAAADAGSKTVMIDATYLKAHHTASSLRVERDIGRLIGRTKGDMNTKLHAVTDANGRPLDFFMTHWTGQRLHRCSRAAGRSAQGTTAARRPRLRRRLVQGKRGRQAADYAACATGSAVCADQFQGMSSSHRAAGQSAAIFPVTSAM
jgi:hypothetical protein